MAMINFKLKHPDDITPWGNGAHTTSMSWFGLTDSEYWLDVGKATIYESSPERVLQEQFDSKYVDYFLVRLIEDLTGLFESIAEPLPGAYYAIAKTYRSLYDFRVKLQRWRDQITEEQYDDSLDDNHQLAEWFASRSLTSMHFAHGPDV